MAVYGKGGIGKSTVTSNLSVLFAQGGHRVLQIGCDPKGDSAHLHVDVHEIRTVLPGLLDGNDGALPEPEVVLSYLLEGRTGVHCLEAGGPEPGRGCAGLGISTVFRLLDQIPGFFARYDTVIFDVLGDVVCGGFAVPLRAGRAREVYIVVSGDIASIFAANNVARAVYNNSRSGARLGGLVVNRLTTDAAVDIPAIEALATRLNTRIVGVIPADRLVTAAAARGGTVSEMYPESDSADAYRALFDTVVGSGAEAFTVPSPMTNQDLFEFLKASGAYGYSR